MDKRVRDEIDALEQDMLAEATKRLPEGYSIVRTDVLQAMPERARIAELESQAKADAERIVTLRNLLFAASDLVAFYKFGGGDERDNAEYRINADKWMAAYQEAWKETT